MFYLLGFCLFINHRRSSVCLFLALYSWLLLYNFLPFAIYVKLFKLLRLICLINDLLFRIRLIEFEAFIACQIGFSGFLRLLLVSKPCSSATSNRAQTLVEQFLLLSILFIFLQIVVKIFKYTFLWIIITCYIWLFIIHLSITKLFLIVDFGYPPSFDLTSLVKGLRVRPISSCLILWDSTVMRMLWIIHHLSIDVWWSQLNILSAISGDIIIHIVNVSISVFINLLILILT